jgi:hypothetical protein
VSADLATLLKTLRDMQVEHAEFHPDGTLKAASFVRAVEPPPAGSNLSDAKDEACRCGHLDYQHNNGLCVLGCEPEKCVSEAQA